MSEQEYRRKYRILMNKDKEKRTNSKEYRRIDPFDIFCWGVGYGQLLAEEERDLEGWLDAFVCYEGAKKMSLPTVPLKRRKPRSEKWRQMRRDYYKKFKKYNTTSSS